MKNLKVEITELFVAKPDKDRIFFGCIKRSRNEKGEMNLFSRIAMPDGGVLCANETDQAILAKNLNSMAVEILDKGLHMNTGVSSEIFGSKFYHNQMKEFELLKRTYPVSRYDRLCDGYDYIIKNSTEEERKEWGLDINGLQKVIKKDEKYIYQVAKENGEFKIMYLCFANYAIIRKFIFKLEDE